MQLGMQVKFSVESSNIKHIKIIMSMYSKDEICLTTLLHVKKIKT